MLHHRYGLLATVVLMAGDSLVAAQLLLDACLANYSQCTCDCSIPLLDQYCPASADVIHCSCTNAQYHAQLVECLRAASCADLAAEAQTASNICASWGYSFVNVQPAATVAPAVATVAPAAATSPVSGIPDSPTAVTVAPESPVATVTTSPANTVLSGAGSPVSTTSSVNGLQTGAIAGIAIGSAAVLILVALGVVLVIFQRRRNNPDAAPTAMPPHTIPQQLQPAAEKTVAYTKIDAAPSYYSNSRPHFQPQPQPQPQPPIQARSFANVAYSEMPSQATFDDHHVDGTGQVPNPSELAAGSLPPR